MELFSEVYGCYFTVIARLLEQSEAGMTKAEMEELVSSYGFYDSSFHLLPALFNNEWNLLKKEGNQYFSKLSGSQKRPYTFLEKAWLKSLLADSRLKLFLDEEEYFKLSEALNDVPILFPHNDFYICDQHSDGDCYEDTGYISRFKTILAATKDKIPLLIDYDSGKGKSSHKKYQPYRLYYSTRDDKFRLQCGLIHSVGNKVEKTTLNLGRMKAVRLLEDGDTIGQDVGYLFDEMKGKDTVTLEISRERNALERVMLQFASFRKETEYDKERDLYTCRIWFDTADKTELLIRILSFGPVVKVLGPSHFLKQVQERLRQQLARQEFQSQRE